MKIKITDGKTEAMAQVENPTGDGQQQISLSLVQARRLDCSKLTDEGGGTYERRCLDMGRIIFSRKPKQENKTNHTAGPWIVTDSGQIKSEAIVRLGFSDYVCQMPYASKAEAAEMPRSVNDARLIAAAPELLEALRFVSKMLDDDGGKVQGVMYSDALAPDNDEQTALEYIQAAIAKAEGR